MHYWQALTPQSNLIIPPELVIAGVGALIAVLGAIAAIAKFVPPMVKRHFDTLQSAQMQAIENDKNARQADIDERRANSQLMLSMADTIKSIGGNLDNLTKAVIAGQTIQTNTADAMKDIAANQSKLNNTFNELLDTGSKPLQELNKKVDDLRLIVLGTQADKERLEKIISDATELINSSTLIVKLAQEKLNDVKRATGETLQPIVQTPATS